MGSYEILNLSEDARSLALNNTTSSYKSMFLQNNPAIISTRYSSVSYSYSILPANVHLVGIQHLSNKKHRIKALKVFMLNYGKIIDSRTQHESNAFDLHIQLGYKKEIKNIISIGISGGYIYSSIAEYHSQLIYSNIGIRNRFFRKKIGLGASIENIGKIIVPYTNIREPLPVQYRLGAYYKLKYIPIIINLDIINKLESKMQLITNGFEFQINKKITIYFGGSINKSKIQERLKDKNKFENIVSDYINQLSIGSGIVYKNNKLFFGLKNMHSAGYILGFTLLKKSF